MKHLLVALSLVVFALTPIDTDAALVRSGLEVPVAGASAEGTFEGTFTLRSFAVQNGSMVAVGTISGIVRDVEGEPLASVLRRVAVPVSASNGSGQAPLEEEEEEEDVTGASQTTPDTPSGTTPTGTTDTPTGTTDTPTGPTGTGTTGGVADAAATATPVTTPAAAAQDACSVHLELTPSSLDLPSLTVPLVPILVDLEVAPGTGSRLGRALCTAASAAANPSGEAPRMIRALNRAVPLM